MRSYPVVANQVATMLAACTGSGAGAVEGTAGVTMVDDEFSASAIRIPVGGTVVWAAYLTILGVSAAVGGLA